MPVAPRSGSMTVLQSVVTTAQNGASLDISAGSNVLIEAAGTFSTMTIVPEISIDGGSVWNLVAVETLSSTTLARVVAIVAAGIYRLPDIGGGGLLRCRTTGTGGSLTCRAAAGVS